MLLLCLLWPVPFLLWRSGVLPPPAVTASGVAEKLFVKPGSPKSVYDFIKDAHEAGVHFKVCTPTLDLWGSDLIPEIEETVGGAYVIEQAMDDDVVTFTY